MHSTDERNRGGEEEREERERLKVSLLEKDNTENCRKIKRQKYSPIRAKVNVDASDLAVRMCCIQLTCLLGNWEK